ncbi:MAG: hypothetical protein ACRCVW_00130 [Brevinema sp.]
MWNFLNVCLPKLAQTSKIFANICHSFYEQFDPINRLVDDLIKNSFPILTSPFLDKIAIDRGITRIKNESLKSYHYRIRYAYHFLKNSSRINGIEQLIRTIIPNKTFHIRELYLENFILGDEKEQLGINTIINSSDQKFYFVIDIHDLTNEESEYLEEIIHLYRPAHVQFRINNIII